VGLENIAYSSEHDFIKENNLVVRSLGTHVQCVMNFSDNLDEDGGTIIVPKFHKHVELWCQRNSHLRKPLPWLALESETELLRYAQRVPMRRGSVLMWNQTMFHGTSPNSSQNCRTAQYLKGFPKDSVSSSRLKRRSEALERILKSKGVYEEVSEIGALVFGLHKENDV
jgi:ectoine hydroxylase-related dioxygenase (phytanoyl-CoA dioxygenase family)